MKEFFRKSGYKATPARIAVLDTFFKSARPLSAEIVYKDLVACKSVKKINEATVYRTLIILERLGVLRRVDLRKESVYFELVNNHHHHIVCTMCDQIEDFEDAGLETRIQTIVKKSSRFKQVTEHSMELFGLCNQCAHYAH